MYHNKYVIFSVLTFFTVLLVSCGGGKPGKVSLKNDTDSASYFFGYFQGQQYEAQGIELNTLALAKGWQDAHDGVKLDTVGDEVGRVMERYSTGAQKRAQEKAAKEGEIALKEGQEFLEANKKKQGVVTLPSGLQYKIIREGTGAKPSQDDVVEMRYHGTLIDGTVFDSTKDREQPVSFPVNGGIQGFSEALMLMNEGSIWEIYIPGNLGYGENPRPGGPIKPNSVLIFEIDMVKVTKQEPMPEMPVMPQE